MFIHTFNILKPRSSVLLKQCRYAGTAALYDVAVIGGGPGGYVAAIRAAQHGLNTVCIEKRGTLGGTCLNVGCIPSKVLLNISHEYHKLDSHKRFGIETQGKNFNFQKTQEYKGKTMKTLMSGIEGLFKMNKIDYKKGSAKLIKPDTIEVTNSSGKTTINAKHIIVATGSETSLLPNISIEPDEKVILTSTGALNLEKIPKKMIVVGGGVIGLELGSVYSRFGTEVTVVEFLDRVVPAFDQQVGKELQKILSKQGLKFMLSTQVTNIEKDNEHSKLTIKSLKDNSTQVLESDTVLIAVGRKPNSKKLGLESLDIQVDKAGHIITNSEYRVPNHPNIFAIGDVITGPMLAHKAEEEGIAAADIIATGRGHVNYNAIPSVIYTAPEVAGVGKTEEELKAAKASYGKGVFPFAANSRARVNDETDGFVKILTEKGSNKILGAWIIGPTAGELIQQLVFAIEHGASSEDVARVCHAHPALSEAVREASLASYRKAIHSK